MKLGTSPADVFLQSRWCETDRCSHEWEGWPSRVQLAHLFKACGGAKAVVLEPITLYSAHRHGCPRVAPVLVLPSPKVSRRPHLISPLKLSARANLSLNATGVQNGHSKNLLHVRLANHAGEEITITSVHGQYREAGGRQRKLRNVNPSFRSWSGKSEADTSVR